MSEWFVIILFSALFFFLAWYRLSWTIGLTLFLLPAYQLRFSIGFLPMTFLEIMLIAVISVWVVKTLLNRTLQKAWFPASRNSLMRLLEREKFKTSVNS